MFTLRKRAVVDFDGEWISVLTEGVLLLREPASVIRKKSETPVGIAFGYAAEEGKNALKDNQLYCNPFKNGKIADESGAIILFRSVLRKVFGKNPFITVTAIVGGGLTEEDRDDVRRAFSLGGYGTVEFILRPQILAEFLKINDLGAALYMDSDVSEAILVSGGKPLASVSANVSSAALCERIREKLAEECKLLLSPDDIRGIVKNSCSLFRDDATPVTVKGTDLITGSVKTIQFAARELYPICESVYSKSVELMRAILFDVDKDVAIETLKKGVLCVGSGTLINGFPEYWQSSVGTAAHLLTDRTVLLAAAELIANRTE